MAATRPSGRASARPAPEQGRRGPALPNGRHASASSIARAEIENGAPRTVTGPVRAGRRTKLLVKHLARGQIALIDHLDIDRVSAEELIAAGAAAVLNCSASSSGSYPNLGPQLLVEAGILLLDLPDDRLFALLDDGEEVVVIASEAVQGLRVESADAELARSPLHGEWLRGGELLAAGEVLDLARVCAETDARRSEISEALERFAHN